MTEDLPRGGSPAPVPAPDNGQASSGALPSRWSVSEHAVGTEAPDGVNMARYISALRRFKWLIVVATVLGLGAGLGLVRSVKPVYEAQLTLWVENSRGDNGRGPITQEQLLTSFGWVDLLKSYVVLDHAVSRLKLYLSTPGRADSTLFAGFALRERFRPGQYRLAVDKAGKVVVLTTEDGTEVERASPGDSIGRSVGFNWAPPASALAPGKKVDFTVTVPRDVAYSLGERLQIGASGQGNFMKVALDGTNPRALAATLNTIAERYVQVAADLKRNKLTELARILDDQLRQAESHLRQSEGDLQRFRVQTITLPSDASTPVAPGIAITQNPVLQSFFDTKVELGQIQRDQEAIRRVLSQVPDSGLSADALEVIGSVQKSSDMMTALKELTDKRAELRALRYRYTDESPPVRDLASVIDSLERRSIPAIARGLLTDLATREGELSQRVQSTSRELQQIPPRAIQEARLERDVQIASTLYTTLQQRYEEARLAEASSVPDVRVLDHAVAPDHPIKNRAMYLLLMGVLGGLGLGLGGAFVLERFDRRVRYPQQVMGELGLPILGVIPNYSAGSPRAASQAQPVIEAIRGVRMNVAHAYGTAGPLVVTVTSPGSGDGKSFVSSNLALSFANAGHRTLLIDGDSRRGALHRVMRTDRKPGLTDVLAGQATVGVALRPSEHPQLWFIGCGTRMHNAPELLSSAALPQLLASLRSSYGVIIVDSPPLSAGVDSYALGTVTGNLVLVLRAGATDRDLVETKLVALDRLPIRILGVVMNGVREWSHYRYYSYYLPGYESEDERAETRLLGGATRA